MYYIPVSLITESSSAEEKEEIKYLAIQHGTPEDFTTEDFVDYFLNTVLANMVKEHVRQGMTLSLSLITDENGTTCYRDVTVLATGVGKDDKGNTVFFTSVGPITVID